MIEQQVKEFQDSFPVGRLGGGVVGGLGRRADAGDFYPVPDLRVVVAES